MPIMDKEALLAAIASGKIGAISLDTTVFDSKQRNFRDPVLRSLSQFKGGPVRIIIVDVISNEMCAHLEEEAVKTQRALKTAVRKQKLRWHRDQPVDEESKLLLTASSKDFARAEFNDFARHVGAEVLAVSDVPNAMQEMFCMYFAEKAPFGNASTRKHEFPDAASLLTLEAFAKQHKTLVLCIAQDKSWRDFAETSDRLVAIFPIEETLTLFNEAAAHQVLVTSILEIWKSGGDPMFAHYVDEAIQENFALADFDIKAHSRFEYDADTAAADFIETDLNSLTAPKVLAVSETTVTFSVGVSVKGAFYAYFDFFIWDSVNRERITVGSDLAYVIDEVMVTLTIIAHRDLSKGIEFDEINVSSQSISVNFDDIEPFSGEGA